MQKEIGISIGIMLLLLFAFGAFVGPASTVHAASSISLGSASTFAVLAYSGITNTGTTTITGDVGSYPTPSETGFGTVTITGTNYPGGAPASTQTDLSAAIVQADGYTPTTILTALDSQTLVAGVYTSASTTFTLSGGVLTLNGQGDTSSVWIFQAPKAVAGALSTTGGSVILENGADSCNVFWVTSAGGATIGTYTTFIGTIMAYSSVTLGTGTTLQGAALANTGDVTMDTNTISNVCVTAPITTTSTSTTSTSTTCVTGCTFVSPPCVYVDGEYTNPTTHQIVYFYSLPFAVAYQLVVENGPSGIYGACAPPPITTSTTTSTTALPSCVYLTVISRTSNGNVLIGLYSDIWNSSQSIESGLTPVTFCVPPNTVETVGVFDSGCYMFSHWLDTGSPGRFRAFSITSNTTFTAVYSDACVSTPPTDSVITINTVLNSSNTPIAGIYSTLWQNGAMSQSCFSPCSFTVSNGHTYQVAVADFGNYIFSHWADGTTNRFHTVVVGNTTTTVPLVAVYTTTTTTSVLSLGYLSPTAMAQAMAIQVYPVPINSMTIIEIGTILAVLASFLGIKFLKTPSFTK